MRPKHAQYRRGHCRQSIVASVHCVASIERRDAYTSSTAELVPLPCFAPNSRRRARGFVQLDVYAALAVAKALLTSASPRKRLLVVAPLAAFSRARLDRLRHSQALSYDGRSGDRLSHQVSHQHVGPRPKVCPQRGFNGGKRRWLRAVLKNEEQLPRF